RALRRGRSRGCRQPRLARRVWRFVRAVELWPVSRRPSGDRDLRPRPLAPGAAGARHGPGRLLSLPLPAELSVCRLAARAAARLACLARLWAAEPGALSVGDAGARVALASAGRRACPADDDDRSALRAERSPGI